MMYNYEVLESIKFDLSYILLGRALPIEFIRDTMEQTFEKHGVPFKPISVCDSELLENGSISLEAIFEDRGEFYGITTFLIDNVVYDIEIF